MCPFSILAFLKLTTVYKELTYVHNLTDNFNFLITTQAMKYFDIDYRLLFVCIRCDTYSATLCTINYETFVPYFFTFRFTETTLLYRI